MKFVARYKCAVCSAEVILIRAFDSIEDGRSWQQWAEKHGCMCVSCHQKSQNEAQHRQHCIDAAAYARKHCWPELTGSPDDIAEAEIVRLNVSNKIGTMLRFREIRYLVISFQGSFFAAHTDAKWWLRYEDNRSLVDWATDFAKFCTEKSVDLTRVYLRYLTVEERKTVDKQIIDTPYVRNRYPAVWIQNQMQKSWLTEK